MTATAHSSIERQAYETAGGVTVYRTLETIPYEDATAPLADALDSHRGVLLASSFEYPGRYTRWDIGFTDPPLAIEARGRRFAIRALNARGRVLLAPLGHALAGHEALAEFAPEAEVLGGTIQPTSGGFAEELRSRQPTIFSLLRVVLAVLAAPNESNLGLYGAFGYDLAFQFEPIRTKLRRHPTQRDLVLYLPDEITLVDHQRQAATVHRYDFAAHGRSTVGLAREGPSVPYHPAPSVASTCDHAPGEYAACVRLARAAFARGDLFEVVPGQTFVEPCATPPAELFRRLQRRNPSPYGALMNLGEAEYLVAASPEMYVRVDGRRIETCPISGTIARGRDAIADAEQILTLLNSAKDAAELTMCTDVDRNDKSRVCEPGSVRVIGRRQIEMYSRLIHTVDHVEGRLRPEFDALDGFLSHAWAVTVTGAPKRWAMQFIEDHERSPRLWYGGAIGYLGCDGNMNTGLTLRTVRIKDGTAEVRAGATLLYDSDPEAEAAECELKAAALLDAIRRADRHTGVVAAAASRPGTGKTVLMVDHQDSFVHMLASYLRETGAEVITLRDGFAPGRLDELAPDLVVLSPGPGRPADFALAATIAATLERGLPIFGVCLGLQGLVEHFGGRLAQLATPMHGKSSRVRRLGGWLFTGLPEIFSAGRYHSLYAERASLPADLTVTAASEDDVVMAVEHARLAVAAVQFHPESILSLDGDLGHRLIANVMANLTGPNRRAAAVR